MSVTGATGERAWLTRNVKVVSGVSFLQDAASELLYPVLPIFLTVVLGAPAVAVGLVEGLAEGVAAVTKVVSGRVSDRYARRPLVGLGYGLAAVGKALVAVAPGWPVVLAGRSVDRFGKGVRGAPRDALIAADVPPDQRGRAFGFHRTADTAGAVVGPLIGLAAYELLDHQIRPLLVIAVVPAVLSALLVLALREPPRAPARSRPAFRPSQLPDRYWRVVGVLGLFSLVNFPDALLLLRLSEIGFGVAAVVLAYVGYNLVYAALSYPAGALADRMPRHRVVAVGLLAFALAYVGLGATRSHLAAWLLLAVYGTFTAFTDGVGKAWVSSLVGERDQGTGQGVFQGVTGAGVLVAGVWAGLAWGADGSLPLVLAGLVALVVAVGLLAAPLLLRRAPGALAR
ncbi:MAG: MFS transporter [Motilibacteraceae bacterium]